MHIAVIPARGGSKRIPKKNIKDFCGKPMISYSIEATLNSNIFDEVIVSTDSKEIAQVAIEHGAKVPFMRPADISDDYASTGDVMSHAVSWAQNNYSVLISACCIYATAPFITKEDLLKAFKIFEQNDWFYVFSATSYPFPIQRAIRRKDSGGIEMFQPNHFSTRSQDLEKSYHDAGQFYFGTVDAWLQKEQLFQRRSEIIVLPRWRVQDIDEKEDWIFAEKLFKAQKK